MTARYLLCPGPVRSRIDGDVHHIGHALLATLYRVRVTDCLVMPEDRVASHRAYARRALLGVGSRRAAAAKGATGALRS